MKRLRLILVGAVGSILGLFVLLLSGVLNFAASSGHWDATDWVLDIAARQSVTLRSIGIEAVALDDPKMIQRGAGHYEMVCAACHGSPGQPPEEFAGHLTPRPPLLVEQMQHWRPPARTFWTVKHGIKRTAMPAWPTQLRDDEIWDVVAFIETMPKLTADQYRELAGDHSVDAACASCHGDDGEGRGAWPRLDIQSPQYLAAALHAFRDGTRASGVMMSAASGLSDAEIDRLANLYGRRHEMVPAAGPAAAIWERGIPERDVPACQSCHGSDARPDFPRLIGQDADYLHTQLELFIDIGAARGGPHAPIMAASAHNLTPDEARGLADWLAVPGPERP
jgi:cytochrome c553